MALLHSRVGWPARKTGLLFGGIFCLLCIFLFFIYPSVLGEGVAAVLGAGPLPAFWAAHDTLYGMAQTGVRLLYVFSMVAVLDFFVLLYTYRLLDEMVVRSGIWRGAWQVAWRAWGRCLGWQAAAGLAVCLLCGWSESFSVYLLSPSLISSSLSGSLWTAMWEISLLCFALGFATAESGLGGLRTGWNLFVGFLPFWVLFLFLFLLLLWGPVALLASFGLENGGLASVILNLWGVLTHFLLMTGALVYLFNRPGLFVPQEQ